MSDDKGGHDSGGGTTFLLEPHTPVPGTPYQVVGVLGSGGMSTVYEALHRDTGEHVALKLLSGHLAKRRVFVKRFLREIQALSVLSGQPHIVRFVGAGTLPNGQPFCAMELLEGSTLRQRLRYGPLPLSQAISYTIQALSAVSAVHGVGIVHRDVKPDNVFLQTTGLCKLLDFGVLKVLVEGGPIDGQTPLTAPQTHVGTTHYIPPEQAAFKTPDHRADIYAAGVMLFELLWGRVPFGELGRDDYLKRVINEGFPSLEDVGATGFPSSIRRVVRVATAQNPDDRYSTASEFIAKLIEAAMCEGIAIPTPRPEAAAESAQASSHVVVRPRRGGAKAWADASHLADTVPLPQRNQAPRNPPLPSPRRAADAPPAPPAAPTSSARSTAEGGDATPSGKATPVLPSRTRERLSLLALLHRDSDLQARPPRAIWVEPRPPSSGEQEVGRNAPPSPAREGRKTPSSSPKAEQVTLASRLSPAGATSSRDSHPGVESPRVRLVAPLTGRSGGASRRAAVALVGCGLLVAFLLARGRDEMAGTLPSTGPWAQHHAAPPPAAGTALPPDDSASEGGRDRRGGAADEGPASPAASRHVAPPAAKPAIERDKVPLPAEPGNRPPQPGLEGSHLGAPKVTPPRRPQQGADEDAHDFKPGIEPGL
ncbi:MAG TPA: protein kinase [Polyangiaceae bacterium]|nr:protein kinase [Polyangiaceae bacterium]